MLHPIVVSNFRRDGRGGGSVCSAGLVLGCGAAVFMSQFYNARALGVHFCMLMLVSVSWASFEGMLLCILNLEWCSSVLVVVAFGLIMGVIIVTDYFLRCGKLERIRCGRVASDDPRGGGTLAVSGSPLRAVIPFVSAAKCCGNSYTDESGSTAKV